MNSSTAARLPLPHASSKNLRARAWFFSSADTGASFPSLPTRFSLLGRQHAHDATRRLAAHRLEAYSPNLVEGEFCELLRLVDGVLGTSRLLSSLTFAAVAFVVESQLAPMRQEQYHLPDRAYRRRQ